MDKFKQGVNFNLFVVVAILMFIAGRFGASYWTAERIAQIARVGQVDSSHPLINQVVTANLDRHFIINFKPLKQEVLDIAKKYAAKKYVYFQYLNNGSWIGLNERDNFTAASTAKVPLAMTIYKQVENGKFSLDQEYSLDELDLDSGFGSLYKVGADQSLSISELVRIMLVYSDNTAKNALLHVLQNAMSEDPLSDVYDFFGWVFDIGDRPSYEKINLKTLSEMFIALYNAKYVNVDHSQEILNLLANTDFNDKIVAGVPNGVVVAHKIGISTVDRTFSDCGIFYVSNRDYLLCVGTEGLDERVANSFMSEVSRAVYNYVTTN
jgi:beta-lactamase class A